MLLADEEFEFDKSKKEEKKLQAAGLLTSVSQNMNAFCSALIRGDFIGR